MIIRPWQPADRDAVIAMILHILQDEFAFPVTRADMGDLEDAVVFYSQDHSGLWCAIDSDDVVGTIALKAFGDDEGALRRMFVAPSHRGPAYNAGGGLLRTLINHARTNGLRNLYLGTTSAFVAAHRFYEKNGFVQIDKTGLPSGFPLMAVDDRFYRLEL